LAREFNSTRIARPGEKWGNSFSSGKMGAV
jgi:hypothetical protein